EHAMRRFVELDFPTTKQEAWKYTNVSAIANSAFPLSPAAGLSDLDIEAVRELMPGGRSAARLVFVDGRFNSALSSEVAPGGGRFGPLAGFIRSADAAVVANLARVADYSNHAFTALNTAFLADGAFVEIPGGAVVEPPIYLVYISTAGSVETVSHPRNLIVAGHHSQAAIIEQYIALGDGCYFTNAVTEIIAGDGAVVDHSKLQQESAAAFHVASLNARQDRDSSLKSYSIALGGALVRNEINFVLDGEGAECQLDGLYIQKGDQHVDNHTLIDHARPHGSSRETYKAILDATSTGVFNGSIVVRKDAQKTDARQSNKYLLLSRDAEINTKPQLEILADDVKCNHGATIGHIDQEAIFYMRSRGIDESAARSLMMYAFCNEIWERISPAELRELIGEAVFTRITGGRGISEEL